jgi:hypothetical protein
VRRLPPYMIVAVCGILFLSAGMVIITADSTEQPPQLTATVELPTPTEVVAAPVYQAAPVVAPAVVVVPTDVPAQPVVVPTDVPVQPVVVPTDVPVQPVVAPTEVVVAAVVAPTDVVQHIQPTAVVDQQQVQPTTIVDATVQIQPTVANPLPASPVPANAGSAGGASSIIVVTPVIGQPNARLGTLPPPANISPTAVNPVVIPTVVLPTVQPTAQSVQVQSLPVLMQVTGKVGAPLRADNSGIKVVLTRPDGSALQTSTDSVGNFIFANLAPGTYRVDADAAGYLSSQTSFTLTQGQNVVLPSASLVGGDTNLDNKIDLSDATLIAANFDGTSVVAGADLNHDGIVDIRDLSAIGAYFGLVGPTQWKS